MKKYIIKDTIVNIENGEEHVYFMGKDGYVHDERTFYWCDGYTRECYAIKKIKKDMNFFIRFIKGSKIINDMECFESIKWKHTYEILVISGNAD